MLGMRQAPGNFRSGTQSTNPTPAFDLEGQPALDLAGRTPWLYGRSAASLQEALRDDVPVQLLQVTGERPERRPVWQGPGADRCGRTQALLPGCTSRRRK